MASYPHVKEKQGDLSQLDIEDLFSGNICRCTGYRSILCGMKTYAKDGNAEELRNTPPYVLDEANNYANNPARWNHPNVTVSAVPIKPYEHRDYRHHNALHPAAIAVPLHPPPHQWHTPSPTSVAMLKRDIATGSYSTNYKLVYGNTSYGVYPQFEWANVGVFVDISGISELTNIDPYPPNEWLNPWSFKGTPWKDQGAVKHPLSPATRAKQVGRQVSIGAGVTIQKLVKWLEADHDEYRAARPFMRACAQHFKRIAGHQVRNAGSIGGSLMMAKQWNFPSDTWTLLDGAQCAVTWWSPQSDDETPRSFEEFQNATGELVVLNVILTLWEDVPFQSDGASSSTSKQGAGQAASVCFASARVAQRLQNAHPLVNFAAFNHGNPDWENSFSCVWGNIDVCNKKSQENQNAESRWPTIPNTSHYRLSKGPSSRIWAATLAGWPADGDTLDTLMEQVEEELRNMAATAEEQGDPVVRCRVATNLLRKYCIVNLGAPSSEEATNSLRQTIYQARTATPSSGSQMFMVNTAEEPVSEPFIKASAIGQTTGEAIYTQSILPPNTIHATFVSSWAAAAKILPFDDTARTIRKLCEHLLYTYGIMTSPQEFHIYTAEDTFIQKINLLNANNWTHATPRLSKAFQSFPSYLLANAEVVYYGQPVAILVGPSERVVTLAADYLGTKKSEFLRLELNERPPILSVQDAIDRGTVVLRLDKDGKTAEVPTVFETASSGPEPSWNAINSVSKDPDGPNNKTSIDFSQFGEGHLILEGEHSVPAQVHFYMETQSALALPPSKNEVSELEGKPMKLYASTQSCMSVQKQVRDKLNSLDEKQTWQVELVTPQVGGGFGGKEVQSNFVALGAAFVASKLDVPCRFVLSRDADMRIIGHRHPMTADWKVAVHKDTGIIKAMQIDYLADAGCTYDATLPIVDLALLTADNAYNIDYFCATGKAYFTNKASNTAMRSFGVVQSLQITEMVLERIAEKYAQNGRSISPFLLRANNFYRFDQPDLKTPFGQPVVNANIDAIWQDMDTMLLGVSQNPIFDQVRGVVHPKLRERAAVLPKPQRREPLDVEGMGFDTLTHYIAAYNEKHAYQKLGLSVLPLKYGISFTSISANMGQCVLQIDAENNVIVQCPGVEMGQGLDTKMKQIASMKLGIYSDSIRYNPDGAQMKYFKDILTIDGKECRLPGTGASTGSDLNGGAIAKACDAFTKWLEEKLRGHEVWASYLKQGRWYIPPAYDAGGEKVRDAVDLWPQAVEALKAIITLPFQFDLVGYRSPDLTPVETEPGKIHKGDPFYYYNYAAASVLALVDCLTGEEMVVSADIIYDTGISLNPAIDIGQVEGGFVQGLGYNTCEEVTHNEKGELTSINTWLYKPPSTLEIPMQFNVHLYPLISQYDEWRDEEKKHAEKAPIAGEGHPANPLRKPGVKLDSHHKVIDPYGIQSSKTTGEPPLVLSNAVYFAIRNALKNYMGVPQYLPGGVDTPKGTPLPRPKGEKQKPADEGPSSQPASFNPITDEFKLICPATTFNIVESIIHPGVRGAADRREKRKSKQQEAWYKLRPTPPVIAAEQRNSLQQQQLNSPKME
eukprot:TRINITY_DN2752_c0_g1_i3.p1 TRINITY_DN2752_c0_g1~~TRINITY_DN2752_c0_g1_i3.p1  ORF type:complete len:1750 (+),score=441.03 TRINITY_DN2752_c0_g1_i3:527-5251(+)